MIESVVSDWFGPNFARLDPLLQDLHRSGGRLRGDVDLVFGRGVAGFLGRHLARRLGIPHTAGRHELVVDISHDPAALYWDRCFDGSLRMASVFRAIGQWPDGIWVETTGPVELHLGVDIVDRGWCWRVRSARVSGVPIPRWLLPMSNAGKAIVDGQYRFFVEFSLPLLGPLLAYRGDLSRQG